MPQVRDSPLLAAAEAIRCRAPSMFPSLRAHVVEIVEADVLWDRLFVAIGPVDVDEAVLICTECASLVIARIIGGDNHVGCAAAECLDSVHEFSVLSSACCLVVSHGETSGQGEEG